MTITLESTGQIVEVNGVKGRVWVGHTVSGTPIQAVVVSIAVRSDESHDLSEFERELKEHHAPVVTGGVFPLRPHR